MSKIYVDEDIRLFEGLHAEELLKKNNDLMYFDAEEKGIHKVPKSRWESAQKYERKTWMNNFEANDDRNYDHIIMFNNLEELKKIKLEFDNVIELGCGPFTNIRLIQKTFNLKNITLLDPLISEYLYHRNCAYKGTVMNGSEIKIINSSIEELDTEDKFDMVVMINVLEHCFDVDLIFNKIKKIMANNGVIIFADVYFKDVEQLATDLYDAGHPIRVSENKIKLFLNQFESFYEKHYHGLYSQSWRNDVYFVGRMIS